MSLLEMLTQQLGGDAVQQTSGCLNTDAGSTNKAISAALPVLVGALAKNAASPDGASALANALDRDHDEIPNEERCLGTDPDVVPIIRLAVQETRVYEPLVERPVHRHVQVRRDHPAAEPQHGGPVGIRHGGGESANRALVWNVGTCASMPRETREWWPHKRQRTDARRRDGQARSSNETW